MNDYLGDHWMNWATVIGYVGFTLFIMWQIFSRSK